MSVVLDIILPDEFEKGNCDECPISAMGIDSLGDVYIYCPIEGRTFSNCPIVCELKQDDKQRICTNKAESSGDDDK